jgi:two-component sensor histidine kinase
MVSAFVVQPLALVIHELLVNATMHGALVGQSGTLAVSWLKLEHNAGFELCWNETSGQTPPERRRSGFGDTMIRGMIEKQLRGEIRREWTLTGLTVTMLVPRGVEFAFDSELA